MVIGRARYDLYAESHIGAMGDRRPPPGYSSSAASPSSDFESATILAWRCAGTSS